MIAIVKYNAGNIRSVENALKRLNAACVISDDPTVLKSADKLILPGVGEASSAMAYLKQKGLDTFIKQRTKPTLGICLGLQLFCSYSEEGNTPCLGIFDEQVKKFPPRYKVPHMGWNEIIDLKGPLFNEVKTNSDLYFVHSYYAEVAQILWRLAIIFNRFLQPWLETISTPRNFTQKNPQLSENKSYLTF